MLDPSVVDSGATYLLTRNFEFGAFSADSDVDQFSEVVGSDN